MSGDPHDDGRARTRVHTVEDLSVNYEGHTQMVPAHLPNVSAGGMFINTSQRFPEGAVLNLRFRLALSGAEICTRCEVRYCQPGVGVGVEFIGISLEAAKQIEHEIELCYDVRRPAKRAVKARQGRRKKCSR